VVSQRKKNHTPSSHPILTWWYLPVASSLTPVLKKSQAPFDDPKP
jgi:hypothetical protein